MFTKLIFTIGHQTTFIKKKLLLINIPWAAFNLSKLFLCMKWSVMHVNTHIPITSRSSDTNKKIDFLRLTNLPLPKFNSIDRSYVPKWSHFFDWNTSIFCCSLLKWPVNMSNNSQSRAPHCLNCWHCWVRLWSDFNHWPTTINVLNVSLLWN